MTQREERLRLMLVTLGVMLGLLLAALDQTIVGTAMPRIVAELNGLDYYSWVVTAYLVASTTVVPISGKLGDLFGRKPFLLAGMAGFVAASALCGLSQTMAQLVVFRGIQGLFGGMLFAMVFTVIADLFPPAVRARVQGIFAGVFGLASVVGPTLGGYLTDNLGWRWVFYVNLPIGIAAVAVIAIWMPFVRSRASWRDIDFAGAATLAGGLVPLLVALSITRDHAWTSPAVAGLLAVAAVVLAVFYVVEQRAAHPIVPFALFRNATFTVSVVTGALVAFGMFGTIVFVPLVFQGVLGVSATNSGQLLTPMMFGLIVASVVTGQLMSRIRRYAFIGTVGIAIMAIGLWLLSAVSPGTPQGDVVRDIVLVGFGLGATMPLYVNAVQSALPAEIVGVATSQIQFWRNVGGTIGTAVLGSLLSNRLPARVEREITALDLPPQLSRALASLDAGGSAQSLFDPQRLTDAQNAIPPQFVPFFEQTVHAARVALATTLHDIFLVGVAVAAVAVVASAFLREVPLRGREPRRSEALAPSFGD